MVQNHGIFQGYNFFHYIGMNRDMRDMFKGSPHYDRTAEFVELYDNPTFDPAAESNDRIGGSGLGTCSAQRRTTP